MSGLPVYRRLVPESGARSQVPSVNGYATDLEVFPDGKTAMFLKWRSDWRGFSITNEPHLLNLQSCNVTPLKVDGLNRRRYGM